MANLAAEQFEVAAYTALIAAAEQAGESEVARLCRLSRSEDEEMAEWLDAQIPIECADACVGFVESMTFELQAAMDISTEARQCRCRAGNRFTHQGTLPGISRCFASVMAP